jgi:hypothetical protein
MRSAVAKPSVNQPYMKASEHALYAVAGKKCDP